MRTDSSMQMKTVMLPLSRFISHEPTFPAERPYSSIFRAFSAAMHLKEPCLAFHDFLYDIIRHLSFRSYQARYGTDGKNIAQSDVFQRGSPRQDIMGCYGHLDLPLESRNDSLQILRHFVLDFLEQTDA